MKLLLTLTLSFIVLVSNVNAEKETLKAPFFEQLIKCVRKMNTVHFMQANINNYQNNKYHLAKCNSTPANTLNNYPWFAEYTEIEIPPINWHKIAHTTGIFGKPWWFLGIMEIADFDKNGLNDIILHSTQYKTRNVLDPSMCNEVCLSDYGYNYNEEIWSESWDALVVLLQISDGKFEVGNRQLFGQDSVGFGNTPRKAIIADVNQDGYPDYLPTGSWEDGRPLLKEDPENFRSPNNWEAPQRIMISNADGTYRIEDLDMITYGHAITTSKMQNGDVHLVYGSGDINSRYWRNPDLYPNPKPGMGHMPAQVRSWYNDSQEEVFNYPYLEKWEFRTSRPETHNGLIYSRYLVEHDPDFLNWVKDDINNRSSCSNIYCADTPVGFMHNHPENQKLQWGFRLYEQIDNEWILIDTLQIATQSDNKIKFYDMGDRSLQGDDRPFNEMPVMDFGNSYGLGIVASDSCTMKLYPDGNHVFIYQTDGGLKNIPKDVDQPVDLEDYMGSIDYIALEIKNGKLVELHNLFPDGHDDSTASPRFHCGEDINGDGYEDMYSVSTNIWYKSSAQKNLGPEFVVWLNNKKGKLIKTPVEVDNTTHLMADVNNMINSPYETHDFNGTEMVIRDINGDGIGDLIQAGPGNGSINDHGNRKSLIRISFGIKPQHSD